MANVGLSKLYGATYTASGTTVTYGTPAILGKVVSLNLTLNSQSDNILYADNAPAESDTQFAGGTVEITTDDLSAETMGTMLGITGETIGSTTDKFYKFGGAQNVPYMGIGAVRKKIVSGVTKYQAIVFNKVQFENMNESMTTQGETISWQTPVISAKVLKDDTANNNWKWVSSFVADEATAENYVKFALGVALPVNNEQQPAV